MLYSGENKSAASFRGKVWQLPNRYWRACNYSGQQCSHKTYNEATKFAAKGKPAERKIINEGVLNEGAKAMAVGRVLVKNGFKLNWKKDGVISWTKGKQFSAHGTTEVHVSNTSAEWIVYIGSSGRSGAAVGRGEGDADLTQWLSKNKIPEGVMEGELQPGERVPLRKPLKDMPDRKVGQDEGINEGPQPHGLVGGKKVTTIRDINHKKSGKVIPAGTSFEMKFSTTEPGVGYINYEGHWMRTQLQLSHKSFRGIGKPPSMKQLQNMDSAGIAKSVTGKRVDLDGHGPDGAPSWLLAMGLI